ncbi:CDP-alcohol phosphatidyltransferase [Streptomyces sp. NPDC048290]|uniref:CDP-alcohol phosphatidyltransferase n=1 Tax=Streptomyces sp. NPDC048290 TaxID=3155811 RepID=UPI003415788C
MAVLARLLSRPRRHVAQWGERHPRAALAGRVGLTAGAAALVFLACVLPNALEDMRPAAFVRIPAELVVAAALLLALPRRARSWAAGAIGAGLGTVTVVNLLDLGFREYLGRGFNPVLDWGLLDDAQSYMVDTMGRTTTWIATVAVVVGAVALVAGTGAAAVRLSRLLGRHQGAVTRGTLITATVWICCATLGVQLAGVPVAADRARDVVEAKARMVRWTLKDEAAFAKEAGKDPYGATPPGQLVPDLRGKDVVFAFIESYGRTAIEDPVTAPGVTGTLTDRNKALEAAGFRAKSGWLTSATFGGSSWLGHSTFLSGLWIDNQQRYRTVTAGDRLTLTKVFQKTGAWDTVGVMPGVQKGWPEQRFFGLDTVYDAFDLGYEGPKFSWSTMPDQYALQAFERLEHGRRGDGERPLMSEIILTSSHQPWAPLPEMVDWDDLGDGSLYDPIEAKGHRPSEIVSNGTRSKEEYGKSVAYSVRSLTEWLERYGTEDTVLVFLGDHQPLAKVTGPRASRDVPVSIVAKDPAVLAKISDWRWTDGLQPGGTTPVWKMSAFRDRFLRAYGSVPTPSGA